MNWTERLKEEFLSGWKPFEVAWVVISLAACGNMSRTQKNTTAGAAIGGAAGYMLGGNAATTLGGAALGGVIGSQVNK